MVILSDNFWRRLNQIAGFFVLGSTFMLLVFMAHLEIKDLDLWLHIGLGRYIFEHNYHVPQVDILSCTLPPGTPWVNHEWLFQVIAYLIYSEWGVSGLIEMQVWVVALTLMVLAFLGFNNKNTPLTFFALFMVSLVYQSRLTIRPDLYSLFFMSIFVTVLGIFIHRKWTVPVLFVIQVLWTNMHGFFFLGPLIVGFCLLGEWIKRSVPLPWEWNKVGRFTDKEYNRLKLILIMIVLACFLTPTGVHGAIYPLKVLTEISGKSQVFFTKIVELQKPITSLNNFMTWNDWGYYKILIIISLMSFIFNRRKLDVGIFLFWLFFLIYSLAAVRNLVYFAIAGYIAFVINVSTIRFKNIVPIRFTEKKFLFITSAFIQVLLATWIYCFYRDVQDNGYYDFEKYERKSEFGGVSQKQFPIKATEFLVKNKVRGNFYNDFNSGAYLVGHCFPNIRVFIDGRTEVYGPDFFKYYLEIQEQDNLDKFKQALKRFQITGIFFNTVLNPAGEQKINYIFKSSDWSLVYFDDDGVIFLKNTPVNRDVIIHNRLDLKNWKTKSLDMYRLGAAKVTPYQNLNRAFTFESLGLYDQAAAEAKAAIGVNPNYPGPYKVLGKIAGLKKDYQGAYENFRMASILSNELRSRLNMAQALSDLKRYDDAEAAYKKIINSWQTNAEARFKLAKIDIELKKYDQAFEQIKEGFRIAPSAGEDLLGLGDIFQERKIYNLSQKCYEMLLSRSPGLDAPYLRLCQLFEKTGRRDKCPALLKAGLQKNPENKALKEKLRSLGIKSR